MRLGRNTSCVRNTSSRTNEPSPKKEAHNLCEVQRSGWYGPDELCLHYLNLRCWLGKGYSCAHTHSSSTEASKFPKWLRYHKYFLQYNDVITFYFNRRNSGHSLVSSGKNIFYFALSLHWLMGDSKLCPIWIRNFIVVVNANLEGKNCMHFFCSSLISVWS